MREKGDSSEERRLAAELNSSARNAKHLSSLSFERQPTKYLHRLVRIIAKLPVVHRVNTFRLLFALLV